MSSGTGHDRVDERSDAREQALILLYECEQRVASLSAVVEQHAAIYAGLTKELADGVEGRRAHIDDLIASHSKGWTLERMPAIDRTILRIGTFELVERVDTPVAVVIDEAVELAKRFSTDDSGRFVNGVLAAIARTVR
jgi:N utilization substance protein B